MKFRIAFLVSLLVSAGVCFAAGSNIYYPHDLVGQVKNLTVRADALGWHIGDSPDPSMCYHYQGLARASGPGTPYLFVSKSGNFPGPICLQQCGDLGLPCTEVGDGPANLLVVRLATRAKDGERLRSNRIVRGEETGDSAPNAADTVVRTITFDGNDGWPLYGHAGGMQMIGDVLAVALEHPYGQEDIDESLNRIQFIDVRNPENPRPLATVPIRISETFTAGAVAVAPMQDGRYLMIVTGKENDAVKVYESDANRADGSTDLRDPNLTFTHKDTWHAEDEPVNPPCYTLPPSRAYPDGYSWGWPEGGTLDYAHQNLNFIREDGPAGQLYLVGTRNDNGLPGIFGADYVDLYSVSWDGQHFSLGCAAQRHVDTFAASDGALLFHTKIADFGAAGGTYVTPTGELIVYGAEHDNDGPSGTVKAGEWRTRDMVRSDSPTYDPTVFARGPYSVPEGGSVPLAASADVPRTKAWAQLWVDNGFDYDDRYLVVDFPDRGRDDFDDFKELDDANFNPLADGLSDQASSVRWFAPVGCTIRLNDDDFRDDSFPGEHVKVLAGTGAVEAFRDLDDVDDDGGNGDMDDAITSIEFFSDCSSYYDRSKLQVAWDTDGNGTFETPGASAAFPAANLDGPSVVPIGVRVQQSTDGRTGSDATSVTVTNVPPAVVTPTVTDTAGRVISAGAGFALLGVPVTLGSTFTDPGKADTQSGAIAWGDNAVSSPADLDEFAQATGGVIGRVKDRHAYLAAGDFSPLLSVTDDDGGTGAAGTTVRVLTAREAIKTVIARLDTVIPTASGAWKKTLQATRDDLDGNLGGAAVNGAVDKIDAGDREAAVLKIQDAIDHLTKAETAGSANYDDLQAILALAADSIAVEANADATAANTPPTAGEAKQLAEIKGVIDLGATRLAAGNFTGAADAFHEAVRRAVAMLERDMNRNAPARCQGFRLAAGGSAYGLSAAGERPVLHESHLQGKRKAGSGRRKHRQFRPGLRYS